MFSTQPAQCYLIWNSWQHWKIRFQNNLIHNFCVWKILMIPNLTSCMRSWHSKPPSHLTNWVLLYCVCSLLGVPVLLDLDSWAHPGTGSSLSILFIQLMTQCQLAPVSVGALTAMTLMTCPVVIIFPWSLKCMWNKAMINLCYRTYLRINGHDVIELRVKWSPNSTKKHISWSVLWTKSYWIG